MSNRLSATAWTDLALTVMADQGVESVRVEPLARTLGVTKGSFYWHFEDRRALLDAVLGRWERLSTGDVIEKVSAAHEAPADQLRELTRVVFRHGGPLDRAIRAWAAHDDAAARAIGRVDAARYAFVRDRFEAHGLPSEASAVRARLFYMALVGEQHTSLRLGRERRVAWALDNLELLLRAH